MKTFMSNYRPYCYALMRIVAGFLFLWHGSQKLFDFPSGMPAGVPAFITYVAGPIELVGGILLSKRHHAVHHLRDNISYAFLNGVSDPLINAIAARFSRGYKQHTDLHYAAYLTEVESR